MLFYKKLGHFLKYQLRSLVLMKNTTFKVYYLKILVLIFFAHDWVFFEGVVSLWVPWNKYKNTTFNALCVVLKMKSVRLFTFFCCKIFSASVIFLTSNSFIYINLLQQLLGFQENIRC